MVYKSFWDSNFKVDDDSDDDSDDNDDDRGWKGGM